MADLGAGSDDLEVSVQAATPLADADNDFSPPIDEARLSADSSLDASRPSSAASSTISDLYHGNAETDNIRVYCRIRPTNDKEIEKGGVDCLEFLSDGQSVRINMTAATNRSPQAHRKNQFTFNRIFQPYTTQLEVYEEVARPLVGDFFRGYNVAVIAYGQTGSGKSYSMMGPGYDDPRRGNKEMDDFTKGVIPRFMEDVFERVAFETSDDVSFHIRASYIEVYMEQLWDLLTDARDPWDTRANKRKRMKIIDSENRGIWVTNSNEREIHSLYDVLTLLDTGDRNRHTAATGANEFSSRSHAIFVATMERTDHRTHEHSLSQLYLVDLAGSEKVAKTGADGQRLAEAGVINKSLLALGNVITRLTSGNKRTHIGYRDSKLTRLLKNSLGGNSKTVILVTGSPNSYNAVETLSTLRFGDRCSQIENLPEVNTYKSIEELTFMLAQTQSEVVRLETENRRLLSAYQQLLLAKGVPADVLANPAAAMGSSWGSQRSSGSAASGKKKKSKKKLKKGKSRAEVVEDGGAADGGDLTLEELIASPTGGGGADNAMPDTSTLAPRQAGAAPRDMHAPLTRTSMVMRPDEIRTRERIEMFCMLCPLSRAVMSDPVVAADGFTYEREAIHRWMENNDTSPVTANKLRNMRVVPNFSLLRLINLRMPTERHSHNPELFLYLPVEMLDEIFQYLDKKALARVSRVCRLFRDVASTHPSWEIFLTADYSINYGAKRRKYQKKAAADPRIVDPFPSAQRLYGMQVEKALKEAGAGGSSTQERTNHIGRSGLYLHAPNRRR